MAIPETRFARALRDQPEIRDQLIDRGVVSEGEDPGVRLLVRAFEMALDPHNPDRQVMKVLLERMFPREAEVFLPDDVLEDGADLSSIDGVMDAWAAVLRKLGKGELSLEHGSKFAAEFARMAEAKAPDRIDELEGEVQRLHDDMQKLVAVVKEFSGNGG